MMLHLNCILLWGLLAFNPGHQPNEDSASFSLSGAVAVNARQWRR